MKYVGSKNRIAKHILPIILRDRKPNQYYVEPFVGGAISFYAVQHPRVKRVIYNELNTSIVSLLEKIKKDGVTPDFYNWISRKEFNDLKNGDDWINGLVKTCWSFGNNQKDYLFGKDIEQEKKLLHEIVVNKSNESRLAINETFKINIPESLFNLDLNKRRLKIADIIKKESGRNIFLERLTRLQQLQQLQILNMSYDEVNIKTPIDETIIYLDPPYFNTKEYEEKVCHNKLLEYINNSPYKIYVSSYEFDLPCVKEFTHRSTLAATSNNKTIERLFCNKVETKTALEELLGL